MVPAEGPHPEERFKKLLHLIASGERKKKIRKKIQGPLLITGVRRLKFGKNFAPDVACHKTEVSVCCCSSAESCSGFGQAIGIPKLRIPPRTGADEELPQA